MGDPPTNEDSHLTPQERRFVRAVELAREIADAAIERHSGDYVRALDDLALREARRQMQEGRP
jgi:hypothetical protein